MTTVTVTVTVTLTVTVTMTVTVTVATQPGVLPDACGCDYAAGVLSRTVTTPAKYKDCSDTSVFLG